MTSRLSGSVGKLVFKLKFCGGKYAVWQLPGNYKMGYWFPKLDAKGANYYNFACKDKCPAKMRSGRTFQDFCRSIFHMCFVSSYVLKSQNPACVSYSTF